MSEPIRILHVVTYMGRGGLETMLMNYYRHVDQSKVQFDFLAHREFRADYDDEIEALGGKIYRLPRLVPWSRRYQAALDAFFSEHPEYKIVHVHQDCLSSVILKVAQKHGVPVRIAHSHNNSQDKNLKYLIKLYYRRLIPSYATELFACSEEAGNWMFGSEKYRVLNNAIDAKRYSFSQINRDRIRCSFGIPENIQVIGHVGRFSPQKNHKFLVDIFAVIKKYQPNAMLMLVGDGELRKSIEAKVKQMGLSDSVIFTGIRNDVPALMQAMDVFVLPSQYEGLGIVAVEAQAAGLPCYISDTVSKAAVVSDLAKQVFLSASAEHWAQIILSVRNPDRQNMSRQISAAGFDIGDNAFWLQNYYIEQWKANA